MNCTKGSSNCHLVRARIRESIQKAVHEFSIETRPDFIRYDVLPVDINIHVQREGLWIWGCKGSVDEQSSKNQGQRYDGLGIEQKMHLVDGMTK